MGGAVVRRIALAVVAVVLGLTGPAAGQMPIPPVDDGGRFSLRAEYLSWWMKDSPVAAPLVTNGILYTRGVNVLLGGDEIDVGRHNGMRATLRYWFDDDHTWGVEGGGFYLPTISTRAKVTSSGAPGSVHLVVPFFDPVRGTESYTDVSSEGNFSGTGALRLATRLWGAEGNVVWALDASGPWRVELLGGIRYLNFAEEFSFGTSSPDIPPGRVALFRTRDVFDAGNDFYGGQVGVRGRYVWNRFSTDATLKVALGAMRQRLDIRGSLTTDFFTSPGVTQSFVGGIFALPTNIGSYRRDVFAIVPEGGINVGFKLTEWASVVVGYTFLYVSDAVRPAKQIDRVINPSQSVSISLQSLAILTGVPRPSFRFQTSDFWAQGLSAGVSFNF